MLQTLERVSSHCGSERARAQQKVAQYTCGSTSLIILPYIHNEMQIYEGRPSLSLIHSVVKPRSSSFSLSYIRQYYDGFLDILLIFQPIKAQRCSKDFSLQRCGWLKEVKFFVEQLYVLTTVHKRETRSSWLQRSTNPYKVFCHGKITYLQNCNDVNLQKNEGKLEFEFRSLPFRCNFSP